MAEKCLSVVIPCFNEENTIVEILSRVLAQPSVAEVIVINDKSSDNSEYMIQQVLDNRIKYFVNEKNLGKGKSIARGLQLCTAKYVLIQDADLEYSPEEYARLLAPLLDGRADAVYGSRFLTYDSRRALYYWHRVGNGFLTTFSNICTNLDLTDMETCYKVMKISFAKKLVIKESRFGLEPEITAKFMKFQFLTRAEPMKKERK